MCTVEKEIEIIKDKLNRRPMFSIDAAFRSCSQSFNGFITFSELKSIMTGYGIHHSAEDLQLLINRFDRDKDGKVSDDEF